MTELFVAIVLFISWGVASTEIVEEAPRCAWVEQGKWVEVDCDTIPARNEAELAARQLAAEVERLDKEYEHVK